MKGRGAARAPAGRPGGRGRAPNTGPRARSVQAALRRSAVAPRELPRRHRYSARVSAVRQGPGVGLAPLVPGSSGMRASPGRGARAWALSSSPRAARETAVRSGGWTVAGPLPDCAPARAELPGSR